MMTAAHLLKGFGHLTSWLAVLSGPNHVRYRYLHGVHIQIVTSDISACLKKLVLFSRRAFGLAQAVLQRFCGWHSHGVGHHSNPVEQKHGKQEPAPDACEHRELGVEEISDIRLYYALQSECRLRADHCALYYE